MRTSSGVDRSRTEVSSVLMQPDFPEPVVPAIRRCGMRARSVQTAVPEMSLPSQTASGLAVDGRSSKMSPSVTRFGCRLGSSTPTACLPGIGARIRILLVHFRRHEQRGGLVRLADDIRKLVHRVEGLFVLAKSDNGGRRRVGLVAARATCSRVRAADRVSGATDERAGGGAGEEQYA